MVVVVLSFCGGGCEESRVTNTPYEAIARFHNTPANIITMTTPLIIIIMIFGVVIRICDCIGVMTTVLVERTTKTKSEFAFNVCQHKSELLRWSVVTWMGKYDDCGWDDGGGGGCDGGGSGCDGGGSGCDDGGCHGD